MSKLMIFLAFLGVVLSPLYVSAASFYSVDGDKYDVEYNEHGAVLTSEHEKYFPDEESPEGVRKVNLMLYLGVDCDAFSKNYGNGKWGQSPGGFVIRFEHKAFGFIRQEVEIPHDGKCTLSVE